MSPAIALCNEGERLKAEGRYPEAIERYRAALAEDASCVLAHLALAVLLGKVNQHEDAVHHAREAVRLEPDDAMNLTALSMTCQRAWAGTGDARYIQFAEDAMAASHHRMGG